MYRIERRTLDADLAAELTARQALVDDERVAGSLDVQRAWKRAEKSRSAVRTVLLTMTCPRERCMYCVDSHATDVEHFWPKTRFPERMFAWENLLLCCTECGRFKLDRFPRAEDGSPLLVDPTADDPWQHLDFDPDTGALTAAFDPTGDAWSRRGEETVALLHLDRREALQRVYRITFRRLADVITSALERGALDVDRLLDTLRELDDHRLLGWLFSARGASVDPIARFAREHPEHFAACVRRVAATGW